MPSMIFVYRLYLLLFSFLFCFYNYRWRFNSPFSSMLCWVTLKKSTVFQFLDLIIIIASDKEDFCLSMNFFPNFPHLIFLLPESCSSVLGFFMSFARRLGLFVFQWRILYIVSIYSYLHKNKNENKITIPFFLESGALKRSRWDFIIKTRLRKDVKGQWPTGAWQSLFYGAFQCTFLDSTYFPEASC